MYPTIGMSAKENNQINYIYLRMTSVDRKKGECYRIYSRYNYIYKCVFIKVIDTNCKVTYFFYIK